MISESDRPDEEYTGKSLLQVCQDFTWPVYSKEKHDGDIRCLGAKSFEKAEIIEADYFIYDEKADQIDFTMDADQHFHDVPKKFLLFEDEFL